MPCYSEEDGVAHTHVDLRFASLKKVCKNLACAVLFYDQTES